MGITMCITSMGMGMGMGIMAIGAAAVSNCFYK